MGGKETIDKANLIRNEKAEAEAQQARGSHHAAIQPGKPVSRQRERKSERSGNQHHPGNGSDSEHEQIKHCPARFANCSQHEKGNRCRTRQPVDDSDE